jgi:hypothetical protein
MSKLWLAFSEQVVASLACCRTMEIIDQLEQGPRGVYSGA